MVVAHLVLDELRVPAVFYEVGSVGAAERVQIQSVWQLKIPTVATEPAQQRVLGDQRASLAGEQIKPGAHTRLSVGEPVGDHLSSPREHRQDAAAPRRGS